MWCQKILENLNKNIILIGFFMEKVDLPELVNLFLTKNEKKTLGLLKMALKVRILCKRTNKDLFIFL